jgi:hypothetical protein
MKETMIFYLSTHGLFNDAVERLYSAEWWGDWRNESERMWKEAVVA